MTRTVHVPLTAGEIQILVGAMAGIQQPSPGRGELARKLAHAGREAEMPPRACDCGSVDRCRSDNGEAACTHLGQMTTQDWIDSLASGTVPADPTGRHMRALRDLGVVEPAPSVNLTAYGWSLVSDDEQ